MDDCQAQGAIAKLGLASVKVRPGHLSTRKRFTVGPAMIPFQRPLPSLDTTLSHKKLLIFNGVFFKICLLIDF